MCYKDISLKKYVEIVSILTDTELESDERIIYLCLLFDSEILSKPIADFKQLTTEINNLLSTEPSKEPVQNKYKLNGNKYVLHKDFATLTTFQFIDFQNYLKEGFELADYNKILSVFFIPEGETYNNGKYDIKQVQYDIDNYLSIEQALGIADFFLRLSKHFVNYFQKYLLRKMRKLKTKK